MRFSLNETKYRYENVTFILLLFLLLVRLAGGKYLIDFEGQPLKAIENSYSYWLSLLLFFPHYIINNTWACYFVDITTTILPVIAIFSTSNRRFFTGSFLIFLFVQTVTVEIFSCSHSKSVICLFLVTIPLIFEDTAFIILSRFSRYFGASIFISAAYYKYVNGALLTHGNFSITLVNQYSDRAILNPSHWLYQIAQVVINNPDLGDFFFTLLFISQFVFLLTFVTIKFDKLLLIPLISFAFLTYLFMGIYNLDILMIGIPLWFSSQISLLSKIEKEKYFKRLSFKDNL
jgi:hypothetical protein